MKPWLEFRSAGPVLVFVSLMDSPMSAWCLEMFLKIYSSNIVFQFTCLSAPARVLWNTV